MPTSLFFKRYGLLQQANDLLRGAATIGDVLETLRSQARAIADSDGVAVVRREGDQVHYVGEDAIAPLWTGQRFPMRACVSGVAILAKQPIAIPDIAADARVPHSAYLSTFVKSMAMFPLGTPTPVAALGIYWKDVRPLGQDEETLLRFLTHGANTAFERIAICAERTAGRPVTA